MRTAAFALLIALVGVFASESALAHGRGRVHFGFHFGSPFWSPWWHYPPPYYYYPPPATVYVPAQPTTYVEQNPPAVQEQSGWWYYCDASRGYYPYVKECPAGWQRVPPTPSK
jgi:hypothetical protein